MGKHQRSGMTEERRHRAAEALRLRRQGVTQAEISRKHGVSPATTSEDISLALKEITREPAEEVRQMELDRLDEMLARLNGELAQVSKARKEDTITPDKAVNAVAKIVDSQLRVQERRGKLLGLDTVKAEVSMDVAAAVKDALGTITSTSEEDLIEAIGEDV